MFSFKENIKIYFYFDIDLIIYIGKENNENKTLFKLKNEFMATKTMLINQSDTHRIIKNELF